MAQPRLVTRRRVLAGVGSVAATAALFAGGFPLRRADARELPVPDDSLAVYARTPESQRTRPDATHLAWVWQFQTDGDPARIRDTLAANGLGVVVKTHDGVDWMARYSKTGVSGPASVHMLADFFERGGVPFHAWAVVKGESPLDEARMAADVLGSGARSLFLDLESHAGFWQGTGLTAMRFGTEVRRLRPNSWISTSVDPRPWELPRIPLAQFASFTDEISPQTYWNLFRSSANVKGYSNSGERVPAGGITAAFVVESAMRHLRSYGRPIHPIGDGTPGTLSAWGEFINQSYGGDVETVSVWRYGITDTAIWRLLKNTPPKSSSYLVQDGDSLPMIAARLNTTVPALTAANQLLALNSVSTGMRLRVPERTSASAAITATAATTTAANRKTSRPDGTAQRPFIEMPDLKLKAQVLTKKR